MPACSNRPAAPPPSTGTIYLQPGIAHPQFPLEFPWLTTPPPPAILYICAARGGV